jgi:hypothetical protein
MSTKIIRNPSDIPTIQTETINNNPMATKNITTSSALSEFQDQAKTALYILGGQAVAAQGNAIIVPMLLKSQSETTKQIAKAGIPLSIGVLLALTVKNKIIRGLSLGFGTQGVLEAIKLVMPDFAPSEGFGDPSHFVFTDENGNQQQGVVTPQGQIVTSNGQTMMLPQAGQKTSTHATGSGQLGGWDDSQYADDDVEYELV